MNELLDRLSVEQRRLVRPVAGPPQTGSPMLAVLSDRRRYPGRRDDKRAADIFKEMASGDST
jgi:hypothetical protein